MATRRRAALTAIICVGGIAVLGTYVHGYLTHPETAWDIWGGVPEVLRPVYSISMFSAAIGFFPFTLFILLRVDPARFRFLGGSGYGAFLVLYALMLGASAAWMPLTYAMLEAPSAMLWTAILVALSVVALASLGILYGLLQIEDHQPVWWYRLAVAGCVLFCWQTVVLDAIVWTYYFPM